MIQTRLKTTEKPRPDLLHLNGAILCMRQTQAHDCGPRALLTSMLQHAVPAGGLTRLSSLSRLNTTTGASIGDLAQAANRVGWNAAGIHCDWDALHQLGTHSIARLVRSDGRGHFVVVHPCTAADQFVLICDSARGIYRLPRNDFEKSWGGELLLIERQPEPQGKSS